MIAASFADNERPNGLERQRTAPTHKGQKPTEDQLMMTEVLRQLRTENEPIIQAW